MSDYLWDRSGPVDADVEDLERRLRPLAFDAAQLPLRLTARPSQPNRARRFWTPWTIAAASLAVAVVVIASMMQFHTWRLNWAPDRAWAVNGGRSSLVIGAPLNVGATPATVDIARLGVLSAKPGTQLALNDTGPSRHRLTLTRGEINVRVWAPPGRVGVHTPAGDVIDLGCIFTLSVDDAGVAHLHVQTGWVSLQNDRGNSFVPAGASASMTADHEPEVPVYDDAAETFRRTVRSLESDLDSPDPAGLRSVVLEARPRDALTLLMLADMDRLARPVRAALLERLSVFYPAPSPDSISRIVSGDRDAFWAWHNSLPLPSLKNWWANWRDVFPR